MNNIQMAFFRILRLWKKLWPVWFLFIPLGFAIGKIDFSLKSLVFSFFGKADYNTSWWYVSQYIKLMLLFAFVESFLSCYYARWKRTFKIIFLGTIGLVLWATFFIPSLSYIAGKLIGSVSYVIIFYEGYFIAKFDAFDKISLIRGGYSLLGLILLAIVRILWSPDLGWADGDVLLTPMLIYFLLCLEPHSTKIKRIWIYMGEISTYVWLLHGFFLIYFASMFYRLKYMPLIFALFASCSIGLGSVYFVIEKKMMRVLKR